MIKVLDLIKKGVAGDFAPGLPDPERFGDVRELVRHKLIPWVVQKHDAAKAGPHFDIRMGDKDLYSWATKKELPGPGGKISVFQQPLHRKAYANFEGVLEKGYGKGTVKIHDKGKVIVTKAEPDQISFTVAHKKFPENYTLIRTGGPPSSSQRTARGRASQGGTWLMVNTTPRDAAKMLGGSPEEVGLAKLRYAKVPAEDVEKVFDGNYLIQEKLDGASSLFHLLSDRIEALSYRTTKEGAPIVHTYRIFGPGGGKVYTKPIPPELVGTILKGETYGVQKGKVIPPQELGGILNASVVNSLEAQSKKKISLKGMLFDVVRMGKEPVPPLSLTPEERGAKLEEISKFLPKTKFSLPETAETPEEARALFESISKGEHPRTSEGIVAWPKEPGKVPKKVKLFPEADVWVKRIFPGLGKLEGKGAGGFEYSRSAEGPVVGRVGTGFTESTREEMLKDPENWEGRMARISSQGDFPRTGAFRAPAFVALHEDYPAKSAGWFKDDPEPDLSGYTQSELVRHRRALAERLRHYDKASYYSFLANLLGLPASLITNLGLFSVASSKSLSEPVNRREIARLREELSVPKNIKVKTFPMKDFTSWRKLDAHFDPIHKKVVAPRIAGIMAHELGHAGGPTTKYPYVYGVPSIAAMVIGKVFGAPIANIAGSYSAKGESLKEDVTRGALYGMVPQVPTLFEEFQASARAVKAINKLKIASTLKAALSLGAAFGTYGVGALVGGALPGAIGGAVGHSLKKKIKSEEGLRPLPLGVQPEFSSLTEAMESSSLGGRLLSNSFGAGYSEEVNRAQEAVKKELGKRRTPSDVKPAFSSLSEEKGE